MRTLAPVALVAVLGGVGSGCESAWAQPSRGLDAGTRPRTARDAGTSRRDAGRRDSGVDAIVLRPPTHGRIDANTVRQLLTEKRDPIRQCYERALQRDATLRGEIIVRVRVESDGSVSETSTGGDSVLISVGRCIEQILSGARFPRPVGGPATVAAPFVFAPGE